MKQQQEDAAATALAAVPLFAGLPEASLKELAGRCTRRVYPAGSCLFLEGEPGNALYVLEAGEVRALRLTSSGKEVVLATVAAPAAFGELALIDGAPRSATLIATRPSRALLVPRTIFIDMLDRHPSVRDGLLRTLAGLVRAGNERHADTVGLDATARTAKWLVGRSRDFQPDGTSILDLGRTQTELAEELGITRVRLNQVLKSLEASGVIAVEGRQIVIQDEPGLLSLCR